MIAVGVVLLVIQLVRPARNISSLESPSDISTRFTVPGDVHAILEKSCYDCHSNNTVYPWYANIQPVGWWMQWHVNDGKRHLNFSEFASYPERRQKKKFEEIEDAATNGWMPIDSYLWMHHDAKLTEEQSKAVAAWATALK